MNQIFSLRDLVNATFQVFPWAGFSTARNRFLFVLRALYNRKKLIANLESKDQRILKSILARDIRYLGFFVWPYLNKDINFVERFKFIVSNQNVINKDYPWLVFSADERLLVASLSNYFNGLRVELEYAPWFIREGCLNFSLALNDIRLFSIAFSLQGFGPHATAYVGAIQGSADTNQDTYRAIADACCDLRPSDLTFKLFRIFLLVVGIQQLRCIADENRVMHHSFFGDKKANVVAMKYNVLWMDHGGVLDSEGYFCMPVAMQERPLTDVPQKKRGRYKRRLDMYETIKLKMRESVCTYKS